ncbi:MAG TPA: alpha-amylase family glycosyl hydrolase [Anaerolineae bacterium]|nr:alpha-amylase family glycosyl hydrolase [Anaerolineae bacterium]
MGWRRRPVIYEIPTWAWLGDLCVRYRQPLTLENIPLQEWDALAALEIDAVWLMGVWERSPAGIAVSNVNPDLQNEFRRALPDFHEEDNVGSAYCVRNYSVDSRLGGAEGLVQARRELAARGMRLILDFVPNHVALDHPWVSEHPEYFIRGTENDLATKPQEFVQIGGQIIANGRDPYFPPWRDVAQLNAFNGGLRAAATKAALDIAAQCDGMRCDMAMLLLNDIFERTWGARAGARPAAEYWQEIIPTVKAKFPDVIFLAEAYWDLEFELMQKGFDYCYDKRLYDRLKDANAESVREHLSASEEYQDKLVRFIENHDEPRAAASFTLQQERAAAIVVMTLPGAKLIHDGQIEGRKIKLPVFLDRRTPEPRNYELELFYRALLKAIHTDLFHEGEWRLCERHGWIDNASYRDILAWTWELGAQRALVVVNLTNRRSQAMIQLAWDDLRGRIWRLSDTLNGDVFLRDGDQLGEAGLFVDLDAWRFHFLNFE